MQVLSAVYNYLLMKTKCAKWEKLLRVGIDFVNQQRSSRVSICNVIDARACDWCNSLCIFAKMNIWIEQDIAINQSWNICSEDFRYTSNGKNLIVWYYMRYSSEWTSHIVMQFTDVIFILILKLGSIFFFLILQSWNDEKIARTWKVVTIILK